MNLQPVPLEKTRRTKPPPAQVVSQLPRDPFDVHKFADNFDVLVDVAGGAKHLKELVLKLAVSGRLSDASNETADSLLAELERQRLRLGKTGVRVGETSPPVAEDETPYAIPSGWRWIRLRDLGGFLGGGTPSKSNASFWEGPLPWVSPKDMKRPHIDDAEDHISTAAVEESAVKLIPPQSILYVVRGMILAHSFPVAIATREVTINQDMKALVLAMPALSEFILRSCQAARTRVLAKVERSSHGTCRLESEAVEMLPIALPPLAEQKRIVARVDQLMALIDDLEAKQTRKRDLSTRFTKASLEALTTAESAEDFDGAWQRVVENFSALLDRTDKLEELRRAVLNAAVRGHVLAPASRRFDGRVPGQDGPFWIPTTWRWATIDEICIDSFYGPRFGKNEYVKSGGIPTIRTTDMSDDGRIVLRDAPCVCVDPKKADLYRVVDGDLLVTRTGSIGTMAVFRGAYEAIPSAYLIRFRFASTVVPEYVCLCLKSPYGEELLGLGTTRVAQPNVNATSIRAMRIPVPPLAEQKRILARVDNLMRLCDDLEAKLRHAEDRASKLVEAVVQEMVA